MGLFDKVLGSSTIDKLSEAEGMAGIALCAIAADGQITEEEAAGLGTTLSRMQLFSGMSNRQVNDIFNKLVKVVRQSGVDALLNLSTQSLRAELKPTAFAIAADLIMADGHVAGQEKVFLERIQKTLGVTDDLALKIVEVIAIKNRG